MQFVHCSYFLKLSHFPFHTASSIVLTSAVFTQISYKGVTLGMVVNTGNLKGHIQEIWQQSNKILFEINAIGSKSQVGTEEIRLKLKLFQLCLMPAILHGIVKNQLNLLLKFHIYHELFFFLFSCLLRYDSMFKIYMFGKLSWRFTPTWSNWLCLPTNYST